MKMDLWVMKIALRVGASIGQTRQLCGTALTYWGGEGAQVASFPRAQNSQAATLIAPNNGYQWACDYENEM